jgi:hypothetical protein
LIAHVEVASSDVVHLLRASNASRGGLFLGGNPENYPHLAPGTLIQIHVCGLWGDSADPDDSDEIQVQGRARIVRVEKDSGGRGFAVEFVDLDGENQARLNNLIARGKPLE